MATTKKTTPKKQTAKVEGAKPGTNLDRAALNRLVTGALARHVRAKMVDGQQVDVDDLFTLDAAAQLDATGIGLYAATKLLAEAGDPPSEDAIARQLGKLHLNSQQSAARRAWRDAAGLEDQLPALVEQLGSLPDPVAAGAVVVDVTNTDPDGRPRFRAGTTFPPGVTVRVALRGLAPWLQVKACKHFTVEVVKGTPPTDRGRSLIPDAD